MCIRDSDKSFRGISTSSCALLPSPRNLENSSAETGRLPAWLRERPQMQGDVGSSSSGSDIFRVFWSILRIIIKKHYNYSEFHHPMMYNTLCRSENMRICDLFFTFFRLSEIFQKFSKIL